MSWRLTARSADSIAPQLDLTNYVAIVTGPTSGIGAETARVLAVRGATVVLAGRSQSKLDATSKTINAALESASSPHKGKIISLQLDTSSFASVKQFASNFTALPQVGQKLHLLFCNAGTMMNPFKLSDDGYDLQMHTNHIGHQMLVQLLLPQLEAAARESGKASRVIATSSIGHNFSDMTISKLDQIFKPTKAVYQNVKYYGHAKLSNILMCREITRRYADKGVVGIAVHPGAVSTNLGQNSLFAGIFYTVLGPLMKSSSQGASTQLYVGLEPGLDSKAATDYYYSDCAPAKPSKLAQDAELAKQVWDHTDRVIQSHL